ncbi:sensor histidine kinase [Planctomonas psychrotolerans]|uniref:sensor histidine kinase n=1 Tax=Planctomonas psychrotolerans TaxID=2528712 RepID=UPI00123B3638|nr:sensor histidine kinase [Planctomonas psychrotolerans]
MPRRIEKFSLVVDLVVALLFLVLLSPFVVGVGATSIPALLGFTGAMAFRRISPGLALGLAWTASVVQMAGGLTVLAFDLAVLAVLYTAAAYGSVVVKWVGLASAGVGGLVAAIYLTAQEFIVMRGFGVEMVLWLAFLLIASWGVLGISWTLGQLVRTRRDAAESRRAQALAEIEQSRALADVAIEQERNRIARDMHDVVAHSLAVVIAQADGARYAKTVDPDAVDQALRAISGIAREALGDVRILLGQLRHSQGAAPAPEVQDIDRLVDQLRSAGLTVRYEQTGGPIHLGTGQQLAVYRIVQEALTNALRHGDPEQAVQVGLRWSTDGVRITVSNGIRPLAPSSGPIPVSTPGTSLPAQVQAGQAGHAPAGHGLAGMRERATLAAGSFDASPTAGGWVVTAWIPSSASTAPIPLQELPS